MAYSTIIKPSDYFNTLLYSGNSTARSLTGVGFEPSWVWIKERTSTSDHMLFDQPRGVQKYISSNLTNAEATSAGMLTAFGSDGFSLGSGNDVNDNGQTYVSWNWKANGQGSSNTDGSINTTYTSANTTSGFSISTYTGTGANATVGHGLGAAPKVVLIKQTNGTAWWFMYHNDLGTTGKLNLNTTGYNNDLQASYWNSTAPSSSVFSLGTEASVNASSQNFVAYCFAEKTGYSKFSSYKGNGNADGPFIYTGFKPAFVITKPSSGVGSWYMLDNKRANPFNVVTGRLEADGSGTENTGFTWCDFTSNGFKIRTTEGGINASGVTFIYMAFAETPFVANSGESIPTTAR